MHFSRVLIASRYPVFLLGLNCLLEAEREFKVVARCTDSASCFRQIRDLAPDIVILDMSMPDLLGQAMLEIASGTPAVRLVWFVTSIEDRDLAMLAAAGAHGVILGEDGPERLLQTIRQVAGGQRMFPPPSTEEAGASAPSMAAEKDLAVLTDRERQIMRLVSEGLSNKEIGRRLNVTNGTIKVHLNHIFRKLEISNRTTLATLAVSTGRPYTEAP
ncbi:LuxR C-terminal-related transcriptional regulator [Bradyrhizobium sp. USDA 3364]